MMRVCHKDPIYFAFKNISDIQTISKDSCCRYWFNSINVSCESNPEEGRRYSVNESQNFFKNRQLAFYVKSDKKVRAETLSKRKTVDSYYALLWEETTDHTLNTKERICKKIFDILVVILDFLKVLRRFRNKRLTIC